MSILSYCCLSLFEGELSFLEDGSLLWFVVWDVFPASLMTLLILILLNFIYFFGRDISLIIKEYNN